MWDVLLSPVATYVCGDKAERTLLESRLQEAAQSGHRVARRMFLLLLEKRRPLSELTRLLSITKEQAEEALVWLRAEGLVEPVEVPIWISVPGETWRLHLAWMHAPEIETIPGPVQEGAAKAVIPWNGSRRHRLWCMLRFHAWWVADRGLAGLEVVCAVRHVPRWLEGQITMWQGKIEGRVQTLMSRKDARLHLIATRKKPQLPKMQHARIPARPRPNAPVPHLPLARRITLQAVPGADRALSA